MEGIERKPKIDKQSQLRRFIEMGIMDEMVRSLVIIHACGILIEKQLEGLEEKITTAERMGLTRTEVMTKALKIEGYQCEKLV